MEAFERSRATRPKLAIARQDFVEYLQSKLRDAAPGTRLEALNGSDLYLAYACAQGEPAALAVFEEEIIAQVPSFGE